MSWRGTCGPESSFLWDTVKRLCSPGDTHQALPKLTLRTRPPVAATGPQAAWPTGPEQGAILPAEHTGLQRWATAPPVPTPQHTPLG